LYANSIAAFDFDIAVGTVTFVYLHLLAT